MSKSKFDGAEINATEKRIEDGSVFETSDLLSVANLGASGLALFRTGNKHIIIESRQITTNGDEITYQAFKGPTVTVDGTPVSVVNRNGKSKIPSTVKVFKGPTVTDDGLGLPPVYMPGATGQGNSTVGQFNQDGFVRILEPDTEYLIKVTNDGAANPAKIEIYLLWAEVVNPAPNL